MLLSVMAFADSLAVLAAFAYPISHAMAGSLAMIADDTFGREKNSPSFARAPLTNIYRVEASESL